MRARLAMRIFRRERRRIPRPSSPRHCCTISATCCTKRASSPRCVASTTSTKRSEPGTCCRPSARPWPSRCGCMSRQSAICARPIPAITRAFRRVRQPRAARRPLHLRGSRRIPGFALCRGRHPHTALGRSGQSSRYPNPGPRTLPGDAAGRIENLVVGTKPMTPPAEPHFEIASSLRSSQ